jgi:hypothetical protein
MMETLFDSIRWAHIAVGFTGLAAFWVPVVAKKGGRTHITAGRIYEWAAYIVAGSAVFNAIGRGIHAIATGAPFAGNEAQFGFLVFLAYLGVVTLAAVRHGVRSVRVKDFSRLRTGPHMALAIASIAGSAIVVAYALLVPSGITVILLALSPIGVLQGRQMIVQMTRPQSERMAWYYAHMGNMIGAGIAFHTAFAVFGSGRIFDLDLPGAWQVLPWVLPAAIGIPANRILETRYRRRFNEPRGGRTPSRREAVPT